MKSRITHEMYLLLRSTASWARSCALLVEQTLISLTQGVVNGKQVVGPNFKTNCEVVLS